MKPEFDILGYLTPYDLVNLSIEDFEYFFVETYPLSSTRRVIYEKDIVIWRNDFGTDRNNIPKGMVKIKFQ